MIEGFAREMPEDLMAEAIATAHDYIREICELQDELAAKAGAVKAQYEVPPPDRLFETLKAKYFEDLQAGQADRRASKPGPRPSRR